MGERGGEAGPPASPLGEGETEVGEPPSVGAGEWEAQGKDGGTFSPRRRRRPKVDRGAGGWTGPAAVDRSALVVVVVAAASLAAILPALAGVVAVLAAPFALLLAAAVLLVLAGGRGGAEGAAEAEGADAEGAEALGGGAAVEARREALRQRIEPVRAHLNRTPYERTLCPPQRWTFRAGALWVSGGPASTRTP